MRESKWTEKEVLEYIQNGWKLYYDKANDKYKLGKYEDGENRFLTLPRSLNNFCRALILEMRENEREEEKREERKEKSKEKNRESVGVGRKHTLEALDQSHAQIVESVTERISWFADVLHEIGFYATLIALQHAKVPIPTTPEERNELYERIAEFEDPRKFVDFVREHLTALLEVSEDARKILELRKEIDILETELALSDMAINKLKAQKQELMLQLYTALASMCEECMMRYNMSWLTAKYGMVISQGGVVSGGGRVDQISGEEEGSSGGGSEITA